MYNKFKDCEPSQTISRVQKIFRENGISCCNIRCNTPNSSSAWSTRINHINSNKVGTNGKGTSYEYALASCLGEFMERLQSGYLSKLNYINKENLDRYNFIRFPNDCIEYFPEKALRYL